MNKIGVIYWSATGNTELMANAIAEGAKSKGSDVSVIDVTKINIEEVKEFDVLALGCPAMGCETIEESTMLPFTKKLNGLITGKKIVLFGSYGWGDGEWMEDWEKQIEEYHGFLFQDSLMVEETPGDLEINACKLLGQKLA